MPAAVLWFGSFVPALSLGVAWYRAAIVVIGGTLAFALGVIGLHATRLNRGPERRAIVLILLGGIIATAGGVSDFVPRGPGGITHLGPLAMLLFLFGEALLCLPAKPAEEPSTDPSTPVPAG